MNSMMGGQGMGARLAGNQGPTGLQNQSNSTGYLKEKIPKGYKAGRLQNFTPEQYQLFQQLFSQTSPDSYLSKLAGGDQGFFDEMEAPALRQFNELQGGLASRFSGMGQGARRSSGFQNQSTAAASNFAQDLASRRQSLQQNAIRDLMGLSNDLLGQKPYEKFLVKKPQQPGFFSSLFGGPAAKNFGGAALGGLSGAASGALSGIAGGPAGMLGGALMGGLGGALSGFKG